MLRSLNDPVPLGWKTFFSLLALVFLSLSRKSLKSPPVWVVILFLFRDFFLTRHLFWRSHGHACFSSTLIMCPEGQDVLAPRFASPALSSRPRPSYAPWRGPCPFIVRPPLITPARPIIPRVLQGTAWPETCHMLFARTITALVLHSRVLLRRTLYTTS